MFQTDPYSVDDPGRASHGGKPVSYDPQQAYRPDQQPYRDYDHPPGRYDASSSGVSSGGGYLEPKYRNYDSHLPYENSVPHYDQQQWSPYSQPPSTVAPQGYDPRPPYSDVPDRQYSPPQRYDEPPPQQGFDGRPRYGKPAGPGPIRYDEPAPPGPVRYDEPPPPGPIRYDEPPPSGLIRHDEPPPPGPSYDIRPRYDQEPHPAARSPDPGAQRPAYNQGPPLPQQHRGYRPQQYDPPPVNSERSPTPPPKADTPSASPGDAAVTTAPKPLPALPREVPQEEDPAMRPQSVLTRVKMFENKRSVSVDRARETGDAPGSRVRYSALQTLCCMLQLSYLNLSLPSKGTTYYR